MTNRTKATCLLLLSSCLFIASCNEGKKENTSTSETPISEKESESEKTKSQDLTWDMLYEVSYGVAVESQIIRSSVTDAGDDIDNIVTYNSCLLDYETTMEEYSYRLYSDHYDENHYKESDPIPYENLHPTRNSLSLMRDYIQGKDGCLLDKRLTKDNKIVTSYGRKDGSTSDTVGINFSSSGFYNFFTAFSPSDFTKGTKEYSFVLDSENMEDPSSLNETAVALTAGLNQTALKSLTLYTDGYHITSYEAELEPVVDDALIPGYVYTFNTYVKGNIIAYGKDDKTVTKHFLKVSEKGEDEKLNSALLSLNQGNYTEKVTLKTKGEEKTQESSVEYRRDGNTMSHLLNDEIVDGYYVTEDNKKQKLRYLNSGFYKDGSEIVNDTPFATFDFSTALLEKKDGNYSFSLIDSGVMDFTSSLLTDYPTDYTLYEFTADILDSSITIVMKGRDKNNDSVEMSVIYSDITTTDNGIDIEHLRTMDDLTWKDLLSSEDYKLASENITEDSLNSIPLLNNGYFDVDVRVYQSILKLDYEIGNAYSLFDLDQNGILSKKETEEYYSYRDKLYATYQKALVKNGYTDIAETKENDHIISMTSHKDSVSLVISMPEKDTTTRDISFRIAVTKSN